MDTTKQMLYNLFDKHSISVYTFYKNSYEDIYQDVS